MAEEEISIEPEKEIEEPIGAESSESEGGSPFDPQEGSKAQPTRAPAESALGEVVEVRIVDELEEIVLSAEMLDDNANWTNYMLYLQSYSGPRIEFLNILEKHTVSMVGSDGWPLAGLPIEFQSNGQTVGWTVTHSDGLAYVFPNALDGLSDLATTVDLVLPSTGESFSIQLGESSDWLFESSIQPSSAPATIDLVLVIDTTGSMADDIDPLIAALNSVGGKLNAQNTSVNVRVAFAEYGDEEFEGVSDDFMVHMLDFAPIDNGYFDQLRNIDPSGGGNESEMLAEGLFFAIDELSWSNTAQARVMLVLADAPPHYPSMGTSYTNAIQAAAESGIKIHTIGATGLNNQGEYILRQMAQYTGGKHIFFALQEGFLPNLAPIEPNSEQPLNIEIEGLTDLIFSLIEFELANLEP